MKNKKIKLSFQDFFGKYQQIYKLIYQNQSINF